MDGVAMGMQQGHHRHVNPPPLLVRQALTQIGIKLQRLDLSAAGVQTTRHLQHLLSQKRTGRRIQGEEVTAMLITDAQLIGQAGIGEQQQGCLLVFQQRIGGHGGAQPNTADQTGGNRRSRAAAHQLGHGHHRRIVPIS